MNTSGVKICPFCSEAVNFSARKCKHCGEWFDGNSKTTLTDIASPEIMIATLLNDRYELKDLLGKGGMASVYRAIHKGLNKEIALKVIHQNLVHDEEFVKRFIMEAQMGASLHHPNIVSVFDVASVDSVHYMAMELVSGNELHHLIRKNGVMGNIQIVQLAKELASALQHIHENNWLHRDVKLSNVILRETGEAVLMDFGIARALNSSGLTQAGMVMGTPEYMSPEQAQGKDLDGRSDLYSLGMLMYECLVGDLPFKGDNPLITIQKLVNEQPTQPILLNPNIDKALNAIIMKLLSKRADDRFCDGAELISALNNIANGELVPFRAESDQESINPAVNEDKTQKIDLSSLDTAGNPVLCDDLTLKVEQVCSEETLIIKNSSLINEMDKTIKEDLDELEKKNEIKDVDSIVDTDKTIRVPKLESSAKEEEDKAGLNQIEKPEIKDITDGSITEDQNLAKTSYVTNIQTEEEPLLVKENSSEKNVEINETIKLDVSTEKGEKQSVIVQESCKQEVGRIQDGNIQKKSEDFSCGISKSLKSDESDFKLDSLDSEFSEPTHSNSNNKSPLIKYLIGLIALLTIVFSVELAYGWLKVFTGVKQLAGIVNYDYVDSDSKWINVSGGNITIGNLKGEPDEQDIKDLIVGGFLVSKTEVTNQEYARFLNAISCPENGMMNNQVFLDIYDADCQITYEHGEFHSVPGFDQYPIVEVTWYGADAYCKYANGRLPLEVEWEYLAEKCSVGIKKYDAYACILSSGNSRTQAVGSMKNMAEISDLFGNVSEWCADWYAPYDRNGENIDARKVVRGGSFLTKSDVINPHRRDAEPIDYANSHTGFRVFRDVIK